MRIGVMVAALAAALLVACDGGAKAIESNPDWIVTRVGFSPDALEVDYLDIEGQTVRWQFPLGTFDDAEVRGNAIDCVQLAHVGHPLPDCLRTLNGPISYEGGTGTPSDRRR